MRGEGRKRRQIDEEDQRTEKQTDEEIERKAGRGAVKWRQGETGRQTEWQESVERYKK